MTDNQQNPQHFADLVVIGSSAGGVEALGIVLNALPASFGAPIVVAQHLDPKRPTQLHTILQHRTALRVELLEGSMRMQGGTVYVVPSNQHVGINDGTVELLADHKDRPRPSIDLLLSTAAASYDERLIAVVLTGAGNDGAQGAVDVKGAGGTVIVQNPQTARYPSMPLALPPSIVDFEADLERIGPLLQELVAGVVPTPPDEKTDDVLRDIVDLVARQTNLNFRSYKPNTILRRINRRMTVVGARSMRDYAAYLGQHPSEVGELVGALLINVTHFFRDAGAWEHLRTVVLPALIERSRTTDRVLRFWSAGCATGEEPYSLAMLLVDLLGAELGEWNIKIFATDVDQQAVAFARLGVYPANLLQSLPDNYRERFFERSDGGGYRVGKTLRQLVIFGEQDLSRSAPFPRIDLVLCRNVLIYFTLELQDYVINQFAFSLSSQHGYLVLGKAETVRAGHAAYELTDKQWKVYRCTGGTLGRQSSMFTSMPHRERLPVRSAERTGERSQNELEATSGGDTNQLPRINDTLLRSLPIGVAVVDRGYRLVTINSQARRLLGVRNITPDQGFLHAVHGIPYAETRHAIDTVFRERATVTLPEIELDVASGGTGRWVSLSVVLPQFEANLPDLAVISVADVTDQVQTRRSLETMRSEQAKLVADLSTANQRLTEVNKELLDANEELQVSNEEMVLTQEELQATLEEFETTNEELQATNEELETSNEELQATNEELQTTNDELQARSGELQALTDMLHNERGRLTEMVRLAPFSIMLLRGSGLIVEAFNAHYGSATNDDGVQGQPLAQVFDRMWSGGSSVVDLAREVYTHDAPRTTPRLLTYVPNQQGDQTEAYFVYTLVPTHDTDSTVNGVVIYAADVTAQRTREAQEELNRLRLIFQHAEQIALALYDANTAKLLTASPRYLQIVERMDTSQSDDVIGSEWHNLECVTPRDESIEQWKEVLQTGEALRLPEVRAAHAEDGERPVWDWSMIPIKDAEGRVRYVLVSAVEITAQVRVREEIQRLDRLKDEFLSVASHELRTPMTPLIGFADLLGRMIGQDGSGTTDARVSRMVGSIQAQLRRLNQLVEDLLDVARLQSGKFTLRQERVVLNELLAQTVTEARMLSQEQEIKLDLPPNDTLPVVGDPVRIQQIVLNLVQNAIKHAAQSPHIDIRLRRVHDNACNADMAEIAVQDYGPGIAPDALPALFERFYQGEQSELADRRARTGLGLGLYIAKQLSEQHGGTIAVESVVNAGSTFTVRLPLVDGD